MAKYLDLTGLTTYDGKIKSYINTQLTPVYKFQGTKTVAQLNVLTITADMNGYVYNVSDSGTLSQGSVSVLAGDNVVIFVSDATTTPITWSWDVLAGFVDLSGYLQKNGFSTLQQDVAGVGAVSQLSSPNHIYIGSSAGNTKIGGTYARVDITAGTGADVYFGNNQIDGATSLTRLLAQAEYVSLATTTTINELATAYGIDGTYKDFDIVANISNHLYRISMSNPAGNNGYIEINALSFPNGAVANKRWTYYASDFTSSSLTLASIMVDGNRNDYLCNTEVITTAEINALFS